jgi:hypothetical protein
VGKINAKASASKEEGYHRILFVGPKPEVGPGDLAETLVNLRLFEDIYVENHRKGYVARVKFFPGCEPKKPDLYIANNVGEDFGTVLKA